MDVAAEVLFDDHGRIAAIRHHWRFDEAFTAFALQGLDTDGDGRHSREELEPLAKENVEALVDYGYFTFVSVGDYAAGFAAPENYRLDLDEARLTLHFTLPLAPAADRSAEAAEGGRLRLLVARRGCHSSTASCTPPGRATARW